jgi:hypothetical protein
VPAPRRLGARFGFGRQVEHTSEVELAENDVQCRIIRL